MDTNLMLPVTQNQHKVYKCIFLLETNVYKSSFNSFLFTTVAIIEMLEQKKNRKKQNYKHNSNRKLPITEYFNFDDFIWRVIRAM